LSWDNIEPESFNRSLYPSPDQMDELFRERRTIRDYKGKKIDRLLLEELAGYIVYAPTHNFNFRIIIIDDELIIDLIDSIILKFVKITYNWFYKNNVIYSLLRLFSPSREHEYLKAKPKLEAAKRREGGFKTKPAAIIMIIGDKRIPLGLESAQYALYNMDLYAQVRGLACRNLVGNQKVINNNNKFRRLVGFKPEERIFGVLTLGYPAVRFRNKVKGKKVMIQWN
jgi:nitroreductase